MLVRKPPLPHPLFAPFYEQGQQLVSDLVESVTHATALPAPVAEELFRTAHIPVLKLLTVHIATRISETRDDPMDAVLGGICSDQIHKAARSLNISGELSRKVVQAAENCLRQKYSLKLNVPVVQAGGSHYNIVSMGRLAHDLNARARDLGLSFEHADKALERAAAEAARETTARATPEPRRVTADELFGDAPPDLQAKPRQKYEFPPEMLADPRALRRAESIANARTYKMRKGVELAPDEDARGKMAASFVQQAKRRRQGANPSAG